MNQSHSRSYGDTQEEDGYNRNVREGYAREVVIEKVKLKKKYEGGKGLSPVDIQTKELQVWISWG